MRLISSSFWQCPRYAAKQSLEEKRSMKSVCKDSKGSDILISLWYWWWLFPIHDFLKKEIKSPFCHVICLSGQFLLRLPQDFAIRSQGPPCSLQIAPSSPTPSDGAVTKLGLNFSFVAWLSTSHDLDIKANMPIKCLSQSVWKYWKSHGFLSHYYSISSLS